MLRSIALKMLHDQWRSLAVWTVLAALLAGFYLSLYPSLGGLAEMRAMMDAMPPEMRAMFAPEGTNLDTPAGYLNIELFSFMLPLIVMAITLTAGGGATAGEEERGTLELLLANPIRRSRVVLEKAIGSALLSGLLSAGLWAALAVTARLVDIDLRLDLVAGAIVSAWLLAQAIGGVAFLVGALVGSRAAAIGIGVGVAVAGFFVNALAPLTDVLEPWRALSLHYHYLGYDPLTNGLDPGHAAVLAVVAIVLVLAAALAFERRDLRA